MIMLGIDVSKTKIDCCIFPQGLTGKRKNKIFTNTESGFGSLLKWLITLKIEPDQVTAIMEEPMIPFSEKKLIIPLRRLRHLQARQKFQSRPSRRLNMVTARSLLLY